MRARTRSTARLVAGVTVLSAGFGMAVASFTGGEAVIGIVSGVLIALTISAVEILLQGRWTDAVRRLPVAVLFLLRTAVYGAAFFAMIHLAVALAQRSWDPLVHPTRVVSNATLLASFGFAFAVNVVIMLARLLGPRVLVSLLTGRYHQPREEQRIVLFMDLRGSTQAAETLGD